MRIKIFFIFFLEACGCFGAININGNYASTVEKLIVYKNDSFSVLNGGPISRRNGGIEWVMAAFFRDDNHQTRAVYEISFINCDPKNAKDAEILFVKVSDINVKFKNLLYKDYEVFSFLLNGGYNSGKYIVVRSADLANLFYPEFYISSLYCDYKKEDKEIITKFLNSYFHTKNIYKDYYQGAISETVDFQNEREISFKQIDLLIDIGGVPESFKLIKKIVKDDDWKIYYLVYSAKGSLDGIKIPIVRIDSGCVSGQIYNDDSCDCLDQLHFALAEINQKKNGLIIHIPLQDGRGYGFAPKAETEIYKRGGCGRVHHTNALNTIEAARLLYSPGTIDIRSYDSLAEILRKLRFTRIFLKTDNILKCQAMKNHGIEVIREETGIQKESCKKHLDAKKNSPFYFNN